MQNFDNPGALMPRLESQTTSERLTDPRLAALYFGTGTSPGFLNQLQEAAKKRLQSSVPLQETAGLSDLQTLGIDKLREGIGAYEPFLKESEQLLRGTVKDFDPSMASTFYNPFEQQVVDQAIADAVKGFEMQEADQRGRDIRDVGESAFGSRANLTAGERQEAFGRGLASTLAGIRQSGYDTALERSIAEFQRKLSAERGLADDLTGLAGLGDDFRSREISNLLTTGDLPRNLQETIFARQFARDTAERADPINVLTGIAQILPQYQPEQVDIGSAYGLAPDPTALGLGSALNAYASLYGAMGPYGSGKIPETKPDPTPKPPPETETEIFRELYKLFPPFAVGSNSNSGSVYG